MASFRARLRLCLTDYDGKEIAVREVEGQFPGEVKVDLGRAPETGYYAIYLSLYAAEGRRGGSVFIERWHEGFSARAPSEGFGPEVWRVVMGVREAVARDLEWLRVAGGSAHRSMRRVDLYVDGGSSRRSRPSATSCASC